MFELGWIELMPKIPLYESFNRPLTYEAQPTREVKNLPPPSCHRKMLDSFAAKMPGRLRAHARLKRGVRDALVASQTNRFDVAHRLWRQTLRDANDSKVPFIATLEASVGKEPSALEALVASRDFKSMNEVAFLLPKGSYAGGRVINAVTWFGGARGGVAHGAVVGCGQGGFQGQCVEGQRDGLWILKGTYPRGHFQVHYTPDDPVGSAT